MITVLSAEPDANLLPSCEYAKARTFSLCPFNDCKSVPSFAL